jgi:hypothetical protein
VLKSHEAFHNIQELGDRVIAKTSLRRAYSTPSGPGDFVHIFVCHFGLFSWTVLPPDLSPPSSSDSVNILRLHPASGISSALYGNSTGDRYDKGQTRTVCTYWWSASTLICNTAATGFASKVHDQVAADPASSCRLPSSCRKLSFEVRGSPSLEASRH